MTDTKQALIDAHPDWRKEAKARGISMLRRTKYDVILDIEAYVPPAEEPIKKVVEQPKEEPEPKITWDRTEKVITDGVQTMSKMPSRHIEPLYPKYIDYGKGAYVYADGKKYIDYPCGLGSILLGYSNDRVNSAIKKQLEKGSIFSLPNRLETELAEKLVQLIPCAEQVRFLKTGSEATAAAVRIARASTGREGIVCIGYHGWHSWYSITTNNKRGIPKSYSRLAGQCTYGDREMIREMFSLSNVVEKEIAAIILEPYIYDAQPDFVEWLVEFAHDNGTLVIFDEVVTGFRTKKFSAQKLFGVTPDLACFGKAMANGLPISVVCGKEKYMSELKNNCLVSSTFGADLLAMAAALETIKTLEEEPVIDHIWTMGQRLIDGFNEISDDMPNTKLTGLPCRTFFEVNNELHKSLLWQECIKRGVLLGYAQFTNYAHSEDDIDKTLEALEEACDVVRSHWDEPIKGFDHGATPASAVTRHRR